MKLEHVVEQREHGRTCRFSLSNLKNVIFKRQFLDRTAPGIPREAVLSKDVRCWDAQVGEVGPPAERVGRKAVPARDLTVQVLSLQRAKNL